MVDMALLVFQHFHIYRRGGWSQSFLSENVFCCLGGGGSYYFQLPALSQELGGIGRTYVTLGPMIRHMTQIRTNVDEDFWETGQVQSMFSKRISVWHLQFMQCKSTFRL